MHNGANLFIIVMIECLGLCYNESGDNHRGYQMKVDTSKLISFFYWLRSISFAMQAVFVFVLIMIASIQDVEPWLDLIVSHPLFGWTIFFLCVSIISSVTIEHLEKR